MGGAVTNICNASTVGDTDGVLRILSLVERVNIFNKSHSHVFRHFFFNRRFNDSLYFNKDGLTNKFIVPTLEQFQNHLLHSLLGALSW